MTCTKRSKWRGIVRRFFVNTFRKKYVRKQLRIRKGSCAQCGKCCRLVYRCPFLTREGKCLIYTSGRPAQCRNFPVDTHDIGRIGSNCGYHF